MDITHFWIGISLISLLFMNVALQFTVQRLRHKVGRLETAKDQSLVQIQKLESLVRKLNK